MSRKVSIQAMALACVVTLAVACTSAEPEPEQIGEFVTSFSEAETGQEWVEEVSLPSAEVIETAGEVDTWVDGLPGNPDPQLFDPLRSADFADHFLLIGGYPQCAETSAIVLVETDDDVRVVFEVAADDPGAVCEWSPYTLDVWSVPLETTDGKAPRHVGITYGDRQDQSSPGRVRSSPVGTLLGTWDENIADQPALDAIAARYRGPVRDAQAVTALAEALESLGGPDHEVEVIRAVDPDGSLLLLVNYSKCTERSHVQADLRSDPSRLWTEIEWDEDVLCAWSPYTIDVWQVDLDDVGEYVYRSARP